MESISPITNRFLLSLEIASGVIVHSNFYIETEGTQGIKQTQT